MAELAELVAGAEEELEKHAEVLKNGAHFQKHGRRRGLGRKWRFVGLSPDYKLLWWRKAPTDTKVIGKVETKQIVEIREGQNTGVFRRDGVKWAREAVSFSIIMPRRTIDLESTSEEQRNTWVAALRALVTYNQLLIESGRESPPPPLMLLNPQQQQQQHGGGAPAAADDDDDDDLDVASPSDSPRLRSAPASPRRRAMSPTPMSDREDDPGVLSEPEAPRSFLGSFRTSRSKRVTASHDSEAHEALSRLQERGEKLENLNQGVQRMENDAANFLEMARALNRGK